MKTTLGFLALASVLGSAGLAAADPDPPRAGEPADEDKPKKKYRAKDERWDLQPADRPAFAAWRRQARTRLGGAPVAEIKVGKPAPGQPTVLHFHGAGVGHENILVWRIARAAEAMGEPIRIVSARHKDAVDVLEAIDGPVVVMGHSAGSGIASLVARYFPGKVKSYVGLAPVPQALKPGLPVPSLVIHGTDDDIIPVKYSRRGQFFNATRYVEMPDVDHSLRFRPRAAGDKKDHNLTPESDEVSRQIVTLLLESVNSVKKSGDNHAHTRDLHPRQPRRTVKRAKSGRGHR